MLVLSRKHNERIRIGDDVIITVVEIRGDKVRIGIDAPKETPVHREEVYAAIHTQAHPVTTERIQRRTIPKQDNSEVAVPPRGGSHDSAVQEGTVLKKERSDETRKVTFGRPAFGRSFASRR